MYVIHTLSGLPYTMSGIRTAWKRAVARARKAYENACDAVGRSRNATFLRGATLKDLRPKALTDAERAGYKVEDLRAAAAHASISTTEGYLKHYREVVSNVRLKLPTKPKTA